MAIVTKDAPGEILQKLEMRLSCLERMGLKYLAGTKRPPAPEVAALSAAAQVAAPALKVEQASAKPSPARKDAPPPTMIKSKPDTLDGGELPPPPKDRASALKRMAKKIADCQQCVLHQTRTNTVPGVGDPHAQLMFVGEGPGYHEDQQGEPFVGRAGDLLTKMIKAMGFSREQVFIGNVVKCRPPGNRDPLPEEIAACEPYLKRQLEIIQPKVIVGLGRHAVQTLLKTKTPISKLRGQWRSYHHIAFMPTFHPAYLLRNPSSKKPCWEDLQAVMVKLEELNK